MDVGAQAHVIREVPAVMVGIGIDDDVVAVPEPIIAVVVLVGRDLEEEAANVESIASAAAQPPDVLRTDGACETPVLPGMIEMEIGVVGPGLVPHPAVVGR